MGRLNRAARAATLSIGALALVGYVIANATLLSAPMLSEDSADYSAIARNLARGRGFTTDATRPIVLGLGLPVLGAPDVTRPPAYTILLSLIMRLTGPTVQAVQIAAFAGLALCAVFLLLAAWRAFEWNVAVVAAVLLVLNPGMLRLTSTGTATVWAATWMTALALCLALIERGPLASPPEGSPTPPFRAKLGRGAVVFAAGVCLALAYLTEYTLILLFVPVLWHLLITGSKRERWWIVVVVAAGFLMLVLPWWIRNYRITHDPLFSLDRYAVMFWTQEHPGTTVYRTAVDPGNPIRYLLTHPRAGISNLARFGGGLVTVLPREMGPMVFLGGLLLYFTGLKREIDRRWRWTILGAFAMISLVSAVTIPFNDANYLTLVPWMALLAAVWFTRAMGLLVGWRRTVVVLLLGTVVFLSAWRERGVLPSQGTQQTVKTLMSLAPTFPQQPIVVVTDVPYLAAWYLDRPTLWLPTRAEDMRAVSEQAGVSLVFYLSSALDSWPAAEGARVFQQLRTVREAPAGLEDKPFPFPTLDRLFVPASSSEQGGAGAEAPPA